jgi:hypothetical protein
VSFSSQVFRQQHVSRSHGLDRAVANLDLSVPDQGDGVLAAGSTMPFQDIPGRGHPKGNSAGTLQGSPLTVGPLGIDEGLEGEFDLIDMRLAVITGIYPEYCGHGSSLESKFPGFRQPPGPAG